MANKNSAETVNTSVMAFNTKKKALALSAYQIMLRIRRIEEGIAERYPEQKMRCPVHLSVGQEAIAVGTCLALEKRDQIVTTHRCHAHYLAKGGDLRAMICELMGRASGCCGGRGGSMHLFDRDAGVLLSLPIVAASIPVGVGAALKMRQRGEDAIVAVFLGDASVEEGVFHESINFASLHGLAVIFICENNEYSVYTPLSQRQPARPLADLGSAHGVRSSIVDGNDVLAVHAACVEAAVRARAGDGPTFLQMNTYRHREHCGPNFDDHLGYRSAEDVKNGLAADPVKMLERALIKAGCLAQREIDGMAAAVAMEFEEAYAYADSAPYPRPESAQQGIYA